MTLFILFVCVAWISYSNYFTQFNSETKEKDKISVSIVEEHHEGRLL